MTVSQAINHMRATYVAKQLAKKPLKDTLVGVTLNRLYRENIMKQPGGVNVWVGAGIDLHTRKPIYVEAFENKGKICVCYAGYIVFRGGGTQATMIEKANEFIKSIAVKIASIESPVFA